MVERDGLIALEHYNSNPKTVKTANDTVYTFTPQHNISLAWVRPEHVVELVNVKVSICCGKTKPLCFYASETNVNIWETGDRYGNA